MKEEKICFINTSKIWGGGEIWQVETIKSFSKKAELISISHPQSKLKEEIKDYATTINFKTTKLSFLNPFALYKAYKLLKKISPTVVMFNCSIDFKVFTMPARWAGVKRILYRRDNGRPISMHFINKYLLKKGITYFMPCSDFIRRASLSKNNTLISKNRIVVIYNSINISNWDLQPFEKLIDKQKGTFYFGCIGRLSHEKGQLALPEIVHKLQLKYNNFKILIAGEGPLEDKLKIKIQETGTEDFFDFLGFINPSKNFMETIDCLLIPSLWEGLPTVAIEAMASYKPVISFEVAGNPEIVHNEVTGITVPPYDTSEFAKAMSFFIDSSNYNKCLEMGKNGRILVEKRFNREFTNKQLEKYLF